ncbi:helix-turn-helix transcriptional regulator [bacterium]|nr:helix-turn-helix transcriptional regulator [bacterium]
MDNDNLKMLGKNIKFYRKQLGFSQEQLAEALSKSRNYIGMIERAEVNLPVGTLFEIAQILDTEIENFFKLR